MPAGQHAATSGGPPLPDRMRRRRLAGFVTVSVLAAVAYAAAIAIPTAIISTPFFRRMTPPTVWSWLFWLLPALLFGPLAASYVAPLRRRTCWVEGTAAGAGLLSYLAVGCPICNKVVVALLGISGALTYFQPVQPLFGAVSVGLLAYALKLRFAPTRRALPEAPP